MCQKGTSHLQCAVLLWATQRFGPHWLILEPSLSSLRVFCYPESISKFIPVDVSVHIHLHDRTAVGEGSMRRTGSMLVWWEKVVV